jgi:hypothetical protein
LPTTAGALSLTATVVELLEQGLIALALTNTP